jgi:Zn-dependent protease
METSNIVAQLIIYMVVLIFAISAHEAAHAWMSNKFGDDTARLLGRVTLNPVAHIDPIGTLLIPIASFIFGHIGGAAAAIPLIGWGKPTPVNPSRWNNQRVANVLVSGAGIMANLLIAIFTFIIFKALIITKPFGGGDFSGSLAEPVGMFLTYSLFMNVSLAIFNLLPFPPLDGSKILETFLPSSLRPALTVLERYGYLILMALIYIGFFNTIMRPIAVFIGRLLSA